MKKIKIRCEGSLLADVDALVPFQGDLKDLSKENYERLKKEILESGFAFPINVWRNGDDLVIISGHQRVRTLQTMRRTGYEIPLIPCVLIQADSVREAKRRVLQDASSYGTVNEDGFTEFLNDSQFDLDFAEGSFRLPDIKWDRFFESHAPEVNPAATTADKRSSSEGVKQVILKFDTESHARFVEFCEVLGHKYHTESITDTILHSLKTDFDS